MCIAEDVYFEFDSARQPGMPVCHRNCLSCPAKIRIQSNIKLFKTCIFNNIDLLRLH